MADRNADTALAQAVSLLNAGRVVEAQGVSRQILAANRRDHRAAAILGQIATILSRHQEAVTLLTGCVKMAPAEIDYQVLLAEALTSQGRFREALSRYKKALKLDASYPPALAGKANTLTRSRKWSEARLLLEPFVAAGTEDASMAVVYARVAVHEGDTGKAVEVASRHTDDPVGDEVRRSLWYDIGKAHEKGADYDKAFEAYTRGNQVRPGRWDATAHALRHDRIMTVFTQELMTSLGDAGNQSQLPVFIVGMPRSGSTLIEQIIDAHPQAYGAGELLAMPDVAASMNCGIGSTLTFPDCVADLARTDLPALGKSYLDQVRTLAPRVSRICDKQLASYELIGLIAMIFPRARIIHSRRDPLDTCLSCYVQKFAPGTPAYTGDLRNLGLAYNDYAALMAHWRGLLGERILEIDYEGLIEDQEGVSRRLIEHLGLGWDDRCLRFYETNRAVTTLSHEQVDKPIYRSSIGRHERFGKHLGPLREVVVGVVRAVCAGWHGCRRPAASAVEARSKSRPTSLRRGAAVAGRSKTRATS
ncbi:MAG: sulfotransferase, partial [Phycisphaerales bacterium]